MPARRAKGDGGITQRHDHKTCPAPVEQLDPESGEMVKVRPAHRCKGRWQGTIPVSPGASQKKYIYGRTKDEVQKKLREAQQQRDAGTLVVSGLSVEAWLWHWLDNIAYTGGSDGIRPQTYRGYKSKIQAYLVPYLGRHKLTDLRPEHIRAMYRSMREGGGERRKTLSESSLRQTHAVLSRALKVAMQEGKIARNPMDAVKPPSTKTNRRAALTVRQAGSLLEHTDDARWWLAVFYGMRQGEVLGLRWCDVDFDTGLIYVVQTLQKDIDGKVIFGPPKSDAGARVVPMIPLMAARLKLAHANAGSPPAGEGGSTELVFGHHTKPGRPRENKRDWTDWRALLAAASTEDDPLPAVSLHSARNSAASLLEAAGVSARLAGQILGHSNVKQTESYQHAAVEQMLAALEAGASVLSLSDLVVDQLPEQLEAGEGLTGEAPQDDVDDGDDEQD